MHRFQASDVSGVGRSARAHLRCHAEWYGLIVPGAERMKPRRAFILPIMSYTFGNQEETIRRLRRLAELYDRSDDKVSLDEVERIGI